MRKLILGGLLAAALRRPARRSPSRCMSPSTPPRPGPEIDRRIYGQFAEHLGHGIYGGVWVGEKSPIPNIHGYRKDVLEALKAIHVPVIRWPGGCFADLYDWRDGIGPRAKRPARINVHWGGVTEDNSFGTHEFMNFSELVGADAYVSLNVGSRSPYDAAQWLEYMTTDGTSLAGAGTPQEWPRQALERGVRGHRQRDLGLRRQHAGGVCRRHQPPLCHLRQYAARRWAP